MFNPKLDMRDDVDRVAPVPGMPFKPKKQHDLIFPAVIFVLALIGFYLFFFGLPGYAAQVCESPSLTDKERRVTIIFKQPDGCGVYEAGMVSVETRPSMPVPTLPKAVEPGSEVIEDIDGPETPKN